MRNMGYCCSLFWIIKHPERPMARHTRADIRRAERRLKEVEATSGATSDSSLEVATELAELYRERGRHSEAIRLGADVLARYRFVYGDHNVKVYNAAHSLAFSFVRAERFDKATEMYRCLAEEARALFSGNDNWVLALEQLETLFNVTQRYTDMLEESERLLEIIEEEHGKYSLEAVVRLCRVRYGLSKLGRFEDALAVDQEIIEYRLANASLLNDMIARDESDPFGPTLLVGIYHSIAEDSFALHRWDAAAYWIMRGLESVANLPEGSLIRSRLREMLQADPRMERDIAMGMNSEDWAKFRRDIDPS